MRIYKLEYKDKETAVKDLISKKVIEIIDDEIVYINGTQALVDVSSFYDSPLYACDIMSSADIDFGIAEVFPENPVHMFAGY